MLAFLTLLSLFSVGALGCGSESADAPKKSKALFDPDVLREDTPEAIDKELAERFKKMKQASDKMFSEEDGKRVLTHKYGKTVLPEKPQRIVVVGLEDTAISMGLPIVAAHVSKSSYLREAFDALGITNISINADTKTINLEEVQAVQPDLILLRDSYDKNAYNALSKIAPVVAYPERAWGTSMECMIRMNSKAIGMPAQGEQLIKDLKKHSDDALNAHPSLKGKKVLFGSTGTKGDFSKIGFYTTHDSRAGFLARNGFGVPKIVAEETKKTDQFFVEVSTEKIERFDDVDVFLTYGPEKDNAKIAGKLKKDELISQMPAVKKGRIAVLGYSNPLAAAANPSPLSIPWGLNKYYDVLADSLK